MNAEQKLIVSIHEAMKKLHESLNTHNAVMYGESYTPNLRQSIILQIEEAAREIHGWAE